MIKVKTFANQDESRFRVYELTARVVEDILYLLDSATGPDGGDCLEEPPSPEISEAYKDFREWIAPQMAASIQGLMVGPLLSGLQVDMYGRASIQKRAIQSYTPSFDRLKSRVNWLVEEIPSLISHYSEVDGDEAQSAIRLVESAQALNLSLADDRAKAREILPDLEKWFMFCNPGARILRGDKDAISNLLDSMDAVRAKVEEYESKRAESLKSLDGGGEADEDSLRVELERVSAKISQLDSALVKLEKTRESIIEKLSEV